MCERSYFKEAKWDREAVGPGRMGGLCSWKQVGSTLSVDLSRTY